MQAFFEFLPLIIFYVVWKLADIYWATGALIAMSALQVLFYIVRGKTVPTKTWIFFGLITIFGGLTILMHDDTFLKWKVTIINGVFSAALIVSQYVFKKNIIKQFLGESLTLPENIWNKLNLSWALFFAFCGALNWYIAFNFEQEIWVNFKVFGLTGLMIIFSVSSIFALYKYLPKEESDS
ncbi:septation protein A [Colwellia sp. UCD-KL20]|uniref:septation protein A n=1 Tax=Colwellia sp. UCD-KL20 TaxID=1917165 RepID=UPI0009712992|nr:septation protein A [Colwellia sp. UCD-KL20]